jgi:hypothetical protein
VVLSLFPKNPWGGIVKHSHTDFSLQITDEVVCGVRIPIGRVNASAS